MPQVTTKYLDLWTSALCESTAGRGGNGEREAYGIRKLRQHILELAVRGTLVPQDPQDEPAAFLLKRASEEKQELIAAGKIRSEKAPLAITNADEPFPVPSNWVFARLGELLLSIKSGGTPSKHNPDFWNGEIPWASVKDLGFGEPVSSTQDHITEAGLDAGSVLAKAGSILICTRMGLGKIGEAQIDVAINQDLKAVTLGSAVAPQYFISYYKTIPIIGTGMTVAGIKQDELLNFLVPLPPLAEQHRIVAKVDELMALCDQLEQQQTQSIEAHQTVVEALLGTLTRVGSVQELTAAWERIAGRFDTLFTTERSVDELKRTILQLSVMGKLVSQDPGDEDIQALLAESDQRRREVAKTDRRANVDPMPILSAEDRWEVPKAWTWRGLADLVLFVDYRGKTPAKQSSGIRLLTAKNVRWRRIDLFSEEFLSEEAYTAWMTRGLPKPGDVLFTTEAPLGNAAVVHLNERFGLAQRVICFQGYGALDPSFLVLQLLSPQFQAILEKNGTGMTAKGIKASKLKQLPISVPPLSEQHRIVARVDELLGLCDALKARIADAQTIQVYLADAVVEQVVA